MKSCGKSRIRERRWEKDLWESIYLYMRCCLCQLGAKLECSDVERRCAVREKRFEDTSSGTGSEEMDGAPGRAVSSTEKKKWTALCDDVFASGDD